MNKVIHYIWLGYAEKPHLVKKCIKSWQKYLPGWEIVEWNEKNINVNLNLFSSYFYAKKKYAFTSDILRLHIISTYGGLYFDTDVELIQTIDDLLEDDFGFLSFENDHFVSPGLVIHCPEKNNNLINKVLNTYNSITLEQITQETTMTIGQYITAELIMNGLIQNNKCQQILDFKIYSSDFFCPTNATWKRQKFTPNTRSIHHYSASWKPLKFRVEYTLKQLVNKALHLNNQVKIILIQWNLLWKK